MISQSTSKKSETPQQGHAHGRGRGCGRGRTLGRGRGRSKHKGVQQHSTMSQNPLSRRLQLQLDIDQVFHVKGDRERFYYEGKYEVKAGDNIVGQGKLLCFKKNDVAQELERQFDFYCHAYLE